MLLALPLHRPYIPAETTTVGVMLMNHGTGNNIIIMSCTLWAVIGSVITTAHINNSVIAENLLL